jgi:hypothetical protein
MVKKLFNLIMANANDVIFSFLQMFIILCNYLTCKLGKRTCC